MAPPDESLLANGAASARSVRLVNKDIETLRAAAQVGASLQAEVHAHRERADDHALPGQPGRRPEVCVHHIRY
jgi:hypothetical protein